MYKTLFDTLKAFGFYAKDMPNAAIVIQIKTYSYFQLEFTISKSKMCELCSKLSIKIPERRH